MLTVKNLLMFMPGLSEMIYCKLPQGAIVSKSYDEVVVVGRNDKVPVGSANFVVDDNYSILPVRIIDIVKDSIHLEFYDYCKLKEIILYIPRTCLNINGNMSFVLRSNAGGFIKGSFIIRSMLPSFVNTSRLKILCLSNLFPELLSFYQLVFHSAMYIKPRDKMILNFQEPIKSAHINCFPVYSAKYFGIGPVRLTRKSPVYEVARNTDEMNSLVKIDEVVSIDDKEVTAFASIMPDKLLIWSDLAQDAIVRVNMAYTVLSADVTEHSTEIISGVSSIDDIVAPDVYQVISYLNMTMCDKVNPISITSLFPNYKSIKKLELKKVDVFSWLELDYKVNGTLDDEDYLAIKSFIFFIKTLLPPAVKINIIYRKNKLCLA